MWDPVLDHTVICHYQSSLASGTHQGKSQQWAAQKQWCSMHWKEVGWLFFGHAQTLATSRGSPESQPSKNLSRPWFPKTTVIRHCSGNHAAWSTFRIASHLKTILRNIKGMRKYVVNMHESTVHPIMLLELWVLCRSGLECLLQWLWMGRVHERKKGQMELKNWETDAIWMPR